MIEGCPAKNITVQYIISARVVCIYSLCMHSLYSTSFRPESYVYIRCVCIHCVCVCGGLFAKRLQVYKIYMYVCFCHGRVCICIHLLTCPVRACMQASHTHTHTHTHTNTHTHTRTHTHTHTYTHAHMHTQVYTPSCAFCHSEPA